MKKIIAEFRILLLLPVLVTQLSIASTFEPEISGLYQKIERDGKILLSEVTQTFSSAYSAAIADEEFFSGERSSRLKGISQAMNLLKSRANSEGIIMANKNNKDVIIFLLDTIYNFAESSSSFAKKLIDLYNNHSDEEIDKSKELQEKETILIETMLAIGKLDKYKVEHIFGTKGIDNALDRVLARPAWANTRNGYLKRFIAGYWFYTFSFTYENYAILFSKIDPNDKIYNDVMEKYIFEGLPTGKFSHFYTLAERRAAIMNVKLKMLSGHYLDSVNTNLQFLVDIVGAPLVGQQHREYSILKTVIGYWEEIAKKSSYDRLYEDNLFIASLFKLGLDSRWNKRPEYMAIFPELKKFVSERRKDFYEIFFENRPFYFNNVVSQYNKNMCHIFYKK